MKRTGFVPLAAGVMLVLASCSPSYKSVKRLQQLEEGVSSPNTVAELKEAIAKYDQRAMDLVATQAQEGIWYKMLGTRYLDQRMYGRAYDAFKKAIEIYPDNANLYYNLGLCASYMANSLLAYDPVRHGDHPEWRADYEYDPTPNGTNLDHKVEYLRTAEEAFQRAIQINGRYYRAMYALGVLYVFNLETVNPGAGETEKAIPYLERFLEAQTKDTDGMIVLARAYYVTGEYDKAIALYDRVIELKPNDDKVEAAQKNKQVVLDAQYKK